MNPINAAGTNTNSGNSSGTGPAPMNNNKNNMDDLQKAGLAVGAVGVLGGVATGIIANGKANALNGQIEDYQGKITELENDRPPITDPYANITDTGEFITNPYASLSVATQAAQIQMDETDIALANTLDTIQRSGMGAGGATALANAAAASKKSVSANIEQQEVNNEKLRAQGELQMNQAKQAEAVRLQNAAVAGEQFVFQQEDARVMQKLNRQQAMLDNTMAQQMQYRSDSTAAFGNAFGGLTSLGTAALTGPPK